MSRTLNARCHEVRDSGLLRLSIPHMCVWTDDAKRSQRPFQDSRGTELYSPGPARPCCVLRQCPGRMYRWRSYAWVALRTGRSWSHAIACAELVERCSQLGFIEVSWSAGEGWSAHVLR